MLRLTPPLLVLATALLGGCLGHSSTPLEGALPRDRVEGGIYRAADPEAPEITLASLPAAERFWPHQIRVVEDWQPDGVESGFGWGMGVLIEVDAKARLRVDFGRFGKYWVPARVTDVIDRANAIRRGESTKFAPNLSLALGNRLLDPTGTQLREAEVDLLGQRLFVLVFADPRSEAFASLATSLAPLASVPRVHVVLLPQNGHPDFHVYKASHEAGWAGSFLLDRFVPAYTEGFLDSPQASAWAEIRTPEGRRLWQGPADSVAEMRRVIGLPPHS